LFAEQISKGVVIRRPVLTTMVVIFTTLHSTSTILVSVVNTATMIQVCTQLHPPLELTVLLISVQGLDLAWEVQPLLVEERRQRSFRMWRLHWRGPR